jgi:F-type H+-transporting ATPase subunit delta
MKITRRVRRAARRLYRACIVGQVLDESRTRRVARRIADARNRGSLPLLTQFRRLVALDRRRHEALVESAIALPSDLRERVESAIVRAYGAGVSTAFAHNAALIGGMRIKVGDDVYDGSVRGALLALEERF